MSLSDATAIARARIAEEAKRRTGSLNLRGLGLDALPKEVSDLTALQQLDCSYTQVSDLSPLASLTALQQLDCSYTQVSDLSPLASLTALQQLTCSSRQVSDLSPLASLTALQQLDCSSTQVSDLSPLASLTALQQLTCSSRQVSDLSPLASLTALQQLDCRSTQVSDLSPLASLTALQQLTCSSRQVSDLSPLASLTALQQLTCSFTQVSDLSPLASLTALQQLDCGFTQVSDLSPLASLTALQQLTCSFTQVSDLSPLASLTALQQLDCRSTQVSDLSPLASLTALQQLDCGFTQVSDLSPLASLTALQQLDCRSTQVSDLSPLASLTALQQLDCRSTQVSDLSPLASLTALQQLDCRSTQVSDLSPLASLTALQQLDCGFTQVSDLSPLASLTALQQLDCSYTQVSDLSPLASLTALQQLDCRSTQVSDLSPLASLTALQQLDCRSTQVSDLSPLASLTALQQLDCSSTQVSDLSPLASLTALQQLDCSYTQVSDLSPLASLTALQQLDCSLTQVSDLSPLASLTALQQLDCRSTQVSDLSPLASLTALQQLDCSWCRLRALPPALRDNVSLRLIAFNAHVPGLPYGILSKDERDDCRAKVKAHFDDLAKGAIDFTDLKLLLLGNGGVGKTQIARWLSRVAFDPEWNSTHGIQIFGQSQSDSIAARLHLHIWDFGGQDIYHGTHSLFLSGPAVLMPVWAKDRENRNTYQYGGLTFRNHPLAYWIDIVRHQASPASPALIIQNKCDQKEQEEPRFPIPEETLNALPYETELRVSPKTERGRGALEEALQDAIAWVRDPKRLGLPQIGAGRLRVLRRLESMRDADSGLPREQRRHRLLEQEDFKTICAEEGISSPAMLLDFLNTNGTIFYRPGLFADRIVLDQGWALEAIYAVFDRTSVYSVLLQAGGRFSRALLGLLIWQEHSDSEQKLLLSMMVSCGICFLHRHFGASDDGNAEYIAPDLLPREAKQLAGRWSEDRPAEIATFHYDLLHGGLIRSIMAEIGHMAGADALYWRGGLYAFEADTRSRLLIEEEMIGDWQGTIRVRTQDGQAAVLLQKAIEVIERVQTHLAIRPTAVERSAPSTKLEEPARMSLQQEKPSMPEWYVSYAWGDSTAEGRAREEVVDRLCDAGKDRGHTIQRDREVLSLGDKISDFMRRIGDGDRVFVILSDKYLRSPYCMFELSEIWRTSRQEGTAFLKRVRVYALPDANVSKPTDWVNWAIHWKQEHDALEDLARQHGLVVLGEVGNRRLTQMRIFYNQVSDILGTLADIVQPRTFEQLERYGFDDLPMPPQSAE